MLILLGIDIWAILKSSATKNAPVNIVPCLRVHTGRVLHGIKPGSVYCGLRGVAGDRHGCLWQGGGGARKSRHCAVMAQLSADIQNLQPRYRQVRSWPRGGHEAIKSNLAKIDVSV